jgi:CDP-diacylglycerol--glycerol-3-phosphate 3-phosphatidyltransferase
LISEFGEKRVEIRMFHTPNLTGVRKAVVPKRINEGWGLQHMKLYGVDDELIMSGYVFPFHSAFLVLNECIRANLSNDYFTNRQDRYHVFKSPDISSYFSKVHSAVCALSFNVLPSSALGGYEMSWPESNPVPSPLISPKNFRVGATRFLRPLVNGPPPEKLPSSAGNSTVVYPLLQFTSLLVPDTSTELPALTALLQSLASPPLVGSSWTFTAGYFNMTPQVRRLLLATNPALGTVVAASPWANGFYKSSGISGMLPDAYTLLSRRFLDGVRWAGLEERIKLMEWRRGTVNEPDGWSYHAKGIWITLPGEKMPSISLVGSSNYTKRSYELDLEANALILTRDEDLMKRLGEEESWLKKYAKDSDRAEFEKPERSVSWKVKLSMWAVRILGGAL